MENNPEIETVVVLGDHGLGGVLDEGGGVVEVLVGAEDEHIHEGEGEKKRDGR